MKKSSSMRVWWLGITLMLFPVPPIPGPRPPDPTLCGAGTSLGLALVVLIGLLGRSLLSVHDTICTRSYETPLPAFDLNFHPQTNYHRHHHKKSSAPEYNTIRLHKSANESLGITLKLISNKLVNARFLYGGLIHQQGLLQVGDRIMDVNQESTDSMSPADLQAMLKNSSGSLVLKAEPGYHDAVGVIVRAHFDYTPRQDRLIPAQDAGMAFKMGDIIKILNQEDSFWWQAVCFGEHETAGLIPCQMLEERRKAYNSIEGCGLAGCIPRKKQKVMYSSHHSGEFESYNMVLYEPIIFVDNFQFRTLVLIVAPNIGRQSLKTRLLSEYGSKFAEIRTHTTREVRPEEDHSQFYFVSEEHMRADIMAHKFIEFGKHQHHLYGIKADSVADVIQMGKMCILDAHPQLHHSYRLALLRRLLLLIAGDIERNPGPETPRLPPHHQSPPEVAGDCGSCTGESESDASPPQLAVGSGSLKDPLQGWEGGDGSGGDGSGGDVGVTENIMEQPMTQSMAIREQWLLQCEETTQMYKEKFQQLESENKQLRKQIRALEERNQVPEGENTGICIRGATIIAETNVVITNDAQDFIWEGHGLKFGVQKNSLPKGVSAYTLNIKASVSGQYDLPKGYKLVSAIYWVTSPGKFVKAIKVEIQHCARVDDSAKLSFVEAKCNQKDLPYTFCFSSEGTFTPQSSYGVISLSEFSGRGVVQEESGHAYYCAQVYTELRHDDWWYHFCLIKDLYICLTTISGKYMKMGRMPHIENLRISFQDGIDCLKLMVPQEGILAKGWKIIPLYKPIITKKNAERVVLLREEEHSCVLVAIWMDSPNPPVKVTQVINIIGVDEPGSYFQMIINPFLKEPSSGAILGSSGSFRGVRIGSSSTGDSRELGALLDESDHFDIIGYLISLKSDKQALLNLGLALGLCYSRLKGMSDSSRSFLNDVIQAWVNNEDYVNQRCPPTWKNLVKALKKEGIGQTGIADKIIQEKLPNS